MNRIASVCLVISFLSVGSRAEDGVPTTSPKTSESTSVPCHVSVVEITPEGFSRDPASVAEFQSMTAKGGECADEMKQHVKDYARSCHAPNHVLAEIQFRMGTEKSVEAELAMECGDSSKRNPASDQTARVNRYMDEAYNQMQTDYDRHPLTGVKLRAPKPNSITSASQSSTATQGVLYHGENLHANKQRWLQDSSHATDASVPDEVVEQRLANRQVANIEARNTTAEQNAYIQEFIENAKADGWSIQVKNGQIQVAPKRRANN